MGRFGLYSYCVLRILTANLILMRFFLSIPHEKCNTSLCFYYSFWNIRAQKMGISKFYFFISSAGVWTFAITCRPAYACYVVRPSVNISYFKLLSETTEPIVTKVCRKVLYKNSSFDEYWVKHWRPRQFLFLIGRILPLMKDIYLVLI